MTNYHDFFQGAATFAPHPWQRELGDESRCADRLLRVPTGFGKTLGVLNTWLYHRVAQDNDTWPRRLVWCLPMRVLVEQTEAEVRAVLERTGLLWNVGQDHSGKVGVHVLMGGANSGDWHLYPEQPAVLVGTQDMLLSRALNRGFGAHRPRWPIDFGLLNQDCLWVMDEVQLMDVGLATSGQLQAFRRLCSDKSQLSRPCVTWWMSATLQKEWLTKSPEVEPLARELPQSSVGAPERKGHLWEDVQKPLRVGTVKDALGLAKLASEAHVNQGEGKDGPTLVVVNRVDFAVQVYRELRKDKSLTNAEIRLVHSRFRPNERKTWREDFLNRAACGPDTNRIVVATQVVEAGVDMSAAVLVTELAPWASLVQRFGRAARWGGKAEVIVADRQVKDDKGAAPYSKEELDAARSALNQINDGSPLALEEFEESHPELLRALYPYAPRHLLLPHELEDLFDTTADLTGADIDISRFIRSGDERDVLVFWHSIDAKGSPDETVQPAREALCHVPFLAAREWLCAKGTQLKPDARAWVWDWLDGEWRKLVAKDIHPGQTILVASDVGGYDRDIGWTPSSKAPVRVLHAPVPTFEERADASENDEHLSELADLVATRWQTIASHGAQVGKEASALASCLCPTYVPLLDLAGRWHDLGKAHDAFQNSIAHAERPNRRDLAKAPDEAWPKKELYSMGPTGHRRGFRHELASTLALFDVLRRHAPQHAALLGPWNSILEATGMRAEISTTNLPPSPIEQEIIELSAEEFDLLAYLICSHHGKVRMAWHASPADQAANDSELRIRGLREGDRLPATQLVAKDAQSVEVPECELTLAPSALGISPKTGRAWTERILRLQKQRSSFQLGYLEALLRIVDIRASKAPVADPLLQGNNVKHEPARSDQPMASSAARGEGTPQVGKDPAEGSDEHGVRGRAGRSEEAGGSTRQPAAATRFVDTRLGRLSYADLAVRLAERVSEVESAVEQGKFPFEPIHEDLILALHRGICADLVPGFVGWRKVDVTVGTHRPPPFFQVPQLMHEYAADLEARIRSCGDDDELLLETLSFAEGRLLSIHPFTDFNGRVTRILLSLLLIRLDLPAGHLVPSAEEEARYLRALRAADQLDWAPLMEVWRDRLSKGETE